MPEKPPSNRGYAGLRELPHIDKITIEPLPDDFPLPPVAPISGEHPRLLFKQSDIATIKQNMSAHQNIHAASKFAKLAASLHNGVLDTMPDNATNLSGMVLATIEAKAFDYAINGNQQNGKNAIEAIKNYMRTVTFMGIWDFSRPIGHAIFVAAQVYDWCYPLLSDEDKSVIIAACEELAAHMEVGYPPSGQGSIVGHAGEAQLLRDLLAFGIAVYDQRPDIYNYTAGRIFEQFVPPRDLWFKSHSHHQGSTYGHYRYYFDTWTQWIIYRMCGHYTFERNFGYVPYEWLYIRRPDGQLLRIGDEFGEGKLRKGQYWDEVYVSLFMAANFYDDPYLKQECILESQGFSRFIYENATVTPVHYLIFNNPNLWGKPQDELPLTKYFGSPAGVMVARTGWDLDLNTDKTDGMDINANAAIAYMKIGEMWTANHHHLDAGNFQLYYKGILASESGFYESYFSPHDKCYNKETIAHNTLLIHDPGEQFFERPNAGGQRRPLIGEPATMEEWMKDGEFETGKVLAHQFGPNPNKPEYSYISGDIAKAYTNKVSEVLRSMMFMPLDCGGYKGMLFVADSITAASSAFKKTFLLHTQQQPQVDNGVSTVTCTDHEHAGAMQMHTLLPHDAQITKIGGEDQEFMINGENYPLIEPVDPASAIEAGSWRLEVSPKAQGETDHFLNVLLVGELDMAQKCADVRLIETAQFMGAQAFDHVCMFNRQSQRVGGKIEFDTTHGSGMPLRIAVCGICAGVWNVRVDNAILCSVDVSQDGGVAYFVAQSGHVELSR